MSNHKPFLLFLYVLLQDLVWDCHRSCLSSRLRIGWQGSSGPVLERKGTIQYSIDCFQGDIGGFGALYLTYAEQCGLQKEENYGPYAGRVPSGSHKDCLHGIS
ncbi:hypothetical protein Nepgr_012951 [Nepenthes gracilis]|uniref:Uncharacterized protein n=1 Tax=Nepenthes gracilis TaxID=150966 RepID=A0AAD3SHU4_NEPGR|nr:hypothetical protein Nepgr_012951 [Nepenthes gracilis]